MFTDIVGFTAMAQSNESQAMEALERHNRLLRPFFPKFHGREVKTMGDSFLIEFESALDAFLCAVDIQSYLHDYNQSSKDEWKVRLRIGVHLGDVIHREGDVFGDAVNIASRIEPLGEPEGVCVSEQVFDQVRNKVPYLLVKLAPKSMKNVQFPIDVYRVVMPWEKETPSPEASQLPPDRIAVLPFANFSPDPSDEYFADGMTDEIISTVSGISGLSVISRTSVMRYKQAAKSTTEIGRELNAGKVLEGSVRKSGNRVRITVQLIDAQNDAHLWSQSYDRDLRDIFETQSDIAHRIADALKLVPAPSLRPRGGAEDVDAYTLCLKARSLWNRRTKEGIEEATLLFEEALKADPDSARAYAGLADCYSIAANNRFIDQKEGHARAKEALDRALRLDEGMADAHAALGLMLWNERRIGEGEAELRRAISLNPSYASAHQWLGQVMLDLGRFDEGVAEINRAYELDPLSPIVLYNVAANFFYSGRNDEALAIVDKLLRVEPGVAIAYSGGSFVYAFKNMKEEARRFLETYRRLSGDECGYWVFLATFEALWGDRDEGLTLIGKAIPLVEKSLVSPETFYAVMNDRDEFFRWAEWSVEHDVDSPSDLRYNPIYKNVRDDPRFAELLKKLRVPS